MRSRAAVPGSPDIRAMWLTKSVAEVSGGRQSYSGMYPTNWRITVPCFWTSRSMTAARPDVGGRRPSRILISVLLPAPLAPTSPMIPGSSSTVSPSSATMPPGNRRVRSDRAIRLMGSDRVTRLESRSLSPRHRRRSLAAT